MKNATLLGLIPGGTECLQPDAEPFHLPLISQGSESAQHTAEGAKQLPGCVLLSLGMCSQHMETRTLQNYLFPCSHRVLPFLLLRAAACPKFYEAFLVLMGTSMIWELGKQDDLTLFLNASTCRVSSTRYKEMGDTPKSPSLKTEHQGSAHICLSQLDLPGEPAVTTCAYLWGVQGRHPCVLTVSHLEVAIMERPAAP